MDKPLAQPLVVAALIQMGLLPIFAQRAAVDRRIVWTEDALLACQHDLDSSNMSKPASALWSTYLKHGMLPQLPKVNPERDDDEQLVCPVCKGDIRECRGMHGFVLKVPCWICHKPLAVCKGTCTPMVATTRRSTRNKRREDAV